MTQTHSHTPPAFQGFHAPAETASASALASTSTSSTYEQPEDVVEVEVRVVDACGRPVYYEVRTRTNLALLGTATGTATQDGVVTTHVVHRRYSDFAAFRQAVVGSSTSTGINIPPLPAKDLLPWWGNTNASTLEARRQGLEAFMGTVARHPVVQTRCGAQLRAFLTK